MLNQHLKYTQRYTDVTVNIQMSGSSWKYTFYTILLKIQTLKHEGIICSMAKSMWTPLSVLLVWGLVLAHLFQQRQILILQNKILFWTTVFGSTWQYLRAQREIKTFVVEELDCVWMGENPNRFWKDKKPRCQASTYFWPCSVKSFEKIKKENHFLEDELQSDRQRESHVLSFLFQALISEALFSSETPWDPLRPSETPWGRRLKKPGQSGLR